MKTVIHIGAPKTGTSALQLTLNEARDDLLSSGILYPGAIGNFYNHTLATANLTPGLSRGIKQLESNNPKQFWRWVNDQNQLIREEVERYAPDTVVISSEYFFVNISHAKDLELLNWLHEKSDSFTILAYLRRPSDWYLSRVQQKLKASFKIIEPSYVVRHILESYQRRFPGKVEVRVFDDNSLDGGDIVSDFATNYMQKAAQEFIRRTQRTNESLSAEGMSVLQTYRRREFSDHEDEFNGATNKLIQRLENIDSKIAGYQRPVLKDHIRRAIDESAVELLWLYEEFGINFPEVDYNVISENGVKLFDAVNVSDICEVRFHRLLTLSVDLMRSMQT